MSLQFSDAQMPLQSCVQVCLPDWQGLQDVSLCTSCRCCKWEFEWRTAFLVNISRDLCLTGQLASRSLSHCNLQLT